MRRSSLRLVLLLFLTVLATSAFAGDLVRLDFPNALLADIGSMYARLSGTAVRFDPVALQERRVSVTSGTSLITRAQALTLIESSLQTESIDLRIEDGIIVIHGTAQVSPSATPRRIRVPAQ